MHIVEGRCRIYFILTVLFLVIVGQTSPAAATSVQCAAFYSERAADPWNMKSVKNYGITPEKSIVSNLKIPITESLLEQEAQYILARDPLHHGTAWMFRKDAVLNWDTPLTQEVLRQLLQIPAVREEFEKTSEEGIHVVVTVEKTGAGGSSHNNATTSWHVDKKINWGNEEPMKQVLVILYEHESNPTEFILSSNSMELFDRVRYATSETANRVIESWPGLQTTRLQSGQVLLTTGNIFHRRTIATRSAWRFFLRIDFRN